MEEKTSCQLCHRGPNKIYFKDVYEMYDKERDSFHEGGRGGNNAVMQGKVDKLTTDNVQVKLVMADNQAKNEKYHQVIETVMAMSRAPTEEMDDMTLQTQQ